MDINRMKVIIPYYMDPIVKRAVDIFREEVAFRTGLDLETAPEKPESGSWIIITEKTTLERDHPELSELITPLPPPGNEGFIISVRKSNGGVRIIVAGSDGRGCLYGVARILRKMSLKTGKIALTDELKDMSLTPRKPLRGHQLAYRDKHNTCPRWDIKDFDRYIRDLALFGSNAVEILPPRTDDNLFSSHFQREPLEMMTELSRLIHSYGMDVWMWYPYMGRDYGDQETYRYEMAERERVFAAAPYIDGLLIPAGDPGEL